MNVVNRLVFSIVIHLRVFLFLYGHTATNANNRLTFSIVTDIVPRLQSQKDVCNVLGHEDSLTCMGYMLCVVDTEDVLHEKVYSVILNN